MYIYLCIYENEYCQQAVGETTVKHSRLGDTLYPDLR